MSTIGVELLLSMASLFHHHPSSLSSPRVIVDEPALCSTQHSTFETGAARPSIYINSACELTNIIDSDMDKYNQIQELFDMARPRVEGIVIAFMPKLVWYFVTSCYERFQRTQSTTRKNRQTEILQQLHGRLEDVPISLDTVQERQLESKREVDHLHEHIHKIAECVNTVREEKKASVDVYPSSSGISPDLSEKLDRLDRKIDELNRCAASVSSWETAPRIAFPARELARLEAQIETQRTVHAAAISKLKDAKLFAEQQLQMHLESSADRKAKIKRQAETTIGAEHRKETSELERRLEGKDNEARELKRQAAGEIARSGQEITQLRKDLEANKAKSDDNISALRSAHNDTIAQLKNAVAAAHSKRDEASLLQEQLDQLRASQHIEIDRLKKANDEMASELAAAKRVQESGTANSNTELASLKTNLPEMQAHLKRLEQHNLESNKRCAELESRIKQIEAEAEKESEQARLAHRRAIAKVFEKLKPEVDAKEAAESMLKEGTARVEELENEVKSAKRTKVSSASDHGTQTSQSTVIDASNNDKWDTDTTAVNEDLQQKLEAATEANVSLWRQLELKTAELDDLQNEMIQREMDDDMSDDDLFNPAKTEHTVPEVPKKPVVPSPTAMECVPGVKTAPVVETPTTPTSSLFIADVARPSPTQSNPASLTIERPTTIAKLVESPKGSKDYMQCRNCNEWVKKYEFKIHRQTCKPLKTCNRCNKTMTKDEFFDSHLSGCSGAGGKGKTPLASSAMMAELPASKPATMLKKVEVPAGEQAAIADVVDERALKTMLDRIPVESSGMLASKYAPEANKKDVQVTAVEPVEVEKILRASPETNSSEPAEVVKKFGNVGHMVNEEAVPQLAAKSDEIPEMPSAEVLPAATLEEEKTSPELASKRAELPREEKPASRSWADGSLQQTSTTKDTSVPALHPSTDLFLSCDDAGYVEAESGVIDVICKRCKENVKLPFEKDVLDGMELRWTEHDKTCVTSTLASPTFAGKTERKSSGSDLAGKLEKHLTVTAEPSVAKSSTSDGKSTAVITSAEKKSDTSTPPNPAPSKPISGMMASKYAAESIDRTMTPAPKVPEAAASTPAKPAASSKAATSTNPSKALLDAIVKDEPATTDLVAAEIHGERGRGRGRGRSGGRGRGHSKSRGAGRGRSGQRGGK